MQYKITVLVLQYNPNFEDLIVTLNSILQQTYKSFEIVITDDGSQKDFFDETRSWFEKKNFHDYVLVKNSVNQGTVKNIYAGLEKCSGKYIKLISPGDSLYCNHTLETVIEEMENNNALFAFGKLAFYTLNERLEVYNERRPYSVKPYLNNDCNLIKKHLLIYQDNISGASVFVQKELLMRLMSIIEGSVKFQEDTSFSLLPFMEERMLFLDEYVVWYENGTGISTSGSEIWRERLTKDTEAFYEILLERYPNDKLVKKALLLQKLQKNETIITKTIKSIIFFDRFIYTHMNKYRKIEGDLPNTDFFVGNN